MLITGPKGWAEGVHEASVLDIPYFMWTSLKKPGKARKAQRKEDGGEKPEMLQEVGGNEGAMRDLGR